MSFLFPIDRVKASDASQSFSQSHHKLRCGVLVSQNAPTLSSGSLPHTPIPRVSHQLAVPFTCPHDSPIPKPVSIQSSPLCIGPRKQTSVLSPRGVRLLENALESKDAFSFI